MKTTKKYFRHDLVSKAWKTKQAVTAGAKRMLFIAGEKVALKMESLPIMAQYADEVKGLPLVNFNILSDILPLDVTTGEINDLLAA